MGQIHELLPKVMAAVGAIPKAQENSAQHYRFRGVDDALKHCNPVLVAHGVSVGVQVRQIIPESFTSETRAIDRAGKEYTKVRRTFHATVLMAVTFFAPDGSSIENIMAGEGLDYDGDKATSKALSAAFKYGLFLGLVIPVDKASIEDSDRPRQRGKAKSQADGSDEPKSAHVSEASPFAKTLAAIKNAHDLKQLGRYEAAMRAKAQTEDSYTADEFKTLEAALMRRREQLQPVNA